MEEATLRRLHAVEFPLHDILEKAKRWGQESNERFPGAGTGEGEGALVCLDDVGIM